LSDQEIGDNQDYDVADHDCRNATHARGFGKDTCSDPGDYRDRSSEEHTIPPFAAMMLSQRAGKNEPNDA